MNIIISKEDINEIFEESKDQGEATVRLYKLAFPDWENIIKIEGWPSIGQEAGEYIHRKFMRFDSEHHPEVISGGLWMNSGFSTFDNEHLGWEIDISTCTATYKEKGE